ncbi:MAG: DNA/RNA nuclease SfsA [Thermoproteales archaeon]|nr:DNA/RNA nuclease SfsA [Thermoproteales archaeon]
MDLEAPIAEGLFIKRLNRFLGIVNIKGEYFYAHIHDPGCLEDLLKPGVRVYLRQGRGKYPYYIYAVEASDGLILIDSALHSRIVEWLISEGYVLNGYEITKREVVFNKSRIDFLLRKGDAQELLEVKGCSLLKGEIALFPDAPIIRGRRHVEELINAVNRGLEAYILFLVVRPGAKLFKPNWETDPKFSQALLDAVKVGVKIIVYKIGIYRWKIKPLGKIPYAFR